ncbi:MAG: hypothetical protein COA66_04200 [Arcobacter sp.]|nr:MAG: hypothetical protein COA66_04200 [Arcobacter sp.]
MEELFEKAFPGGFTKRDEANAIVLYAFRNTFLENLHAGEHSELLNDDKYSRITQDEMKKLMIESSEKIENLLLMRETNQDKYLQYVKGTGMMFCNEWER